MKWNTKSFKYLVVTLPKDRAKIYEDNLLCHKMLETIPANPLHSIQNIEITETKRRLGFNISEKPTTFQYS